MKTVAVKWLDSLTRRAKKISKLKGQDTEKKVIVVKEDQTGERLDTILASLLEMSRSSIQKLIEDGSVTLGGKSIKKNHKASAGEVFEIKIPEPVDEKLYPVKMALDIVYEDEAIIAVNKPKGMVVHPAPGHTDDTLVNALLAHCGESLSTINGEFRPGIVHRIDKDTSGILLVAKNDSAHLCLSRQIKSRSAVRVYEAVVRGNFIEDSGRVEAPIGRHPVYRKKMAVTDKNSRYAATDWEVITRYPGNSDIPTYTHIRCILDTGRTHQIRVHMAHIGHPVAGDSLYGGKRSEFGLQGQCLHAKSIEIDHPVTGERMLLETDLPEDFKRVLTILQRRV
jgi:23S rRNA pseudouridine1911/1915/1917 synthase